MLHHHADILGQELFDIHVVKRGAEHVGLRGEERRAVCLIPKVRPETVTDVRQELLSQRSAWRQYENTADLRQTPRKDRNDARLACAGG